MSTNINIVKLSWRVAEWSFVMGVGRAFTYELIKEGKLKSVKVGGTRVVIVTSLADYLKSCAERDI